jgi:hypothetical protein
MSDLSFLTARSADANLDTFQLGAFDISASVNAAAKTNWMSAVGLADKTGAAITATNPLPVAIVGDSVQIELPPGLAADASLQQIKTTLGAPAQEDGNLAATVTQLQAAVAKLTAILAALGSPLQAGGSVAVSNLPATQGISAAALPLPAGAATAANQPALNADGGGLAHVTNFPATQTIAGAVTANDGGAAITGAAMPSGGLGLTGWLSAIWSKLSGTLAVSWTGQSVAATQSGAWSVAVNNLAATQAISAAALPLPAGAATAANQPALNADGGGVAHVTKFPATQTIAGAVTANDGGAAITGAAIPAGGSGLTGWLSAIWSKLSGTLAVSAAALPLPAGAATDAQLTAIQAALAGLVQAGGSVSVSNLPSTQAIKPGPTQSAGASQYSLPVTSSQTVSLTCPPGATLAKIQVEGADVRWRDDGTAPTTSAGMLASQGATFDHTGPLAALSFIAVSDPATINVSFYE